MSPVNWNTIHAFWMVAKHGSFAAAARVLSFVSPQALHKRVRQLEWKENLDLKLLRSRGVKGVELTEAGRQLHDLVDPLFTSFDRLAAELRGEDSGSLAVAISDHASYNFAQETLRAFHRRFPKVRVRLKALKPIDAAETLEHGQTDIAFCSPWNPMRNCSIRASTPIHFEIVAPKKSRLRTRPVTWSEVLNEPFVLLDRANIIRQALEELLRREGLLSQLRVAAEVSGSNLAIDAVRAGMGVTLIPVGPQAHLSLRGLSRIVPPPGLPRIDLAIICRDDLYMPRYMKVFIEIAASTIRAEISKPLARGGVERGGVRVSLADG